MRISRARELLLGLEPGAYDRTSDATDSTTASRGHSASPISGWAGLEYAAWPADLQLDDDLEAIVAFAGRHAFLPCEVRNTKVGFERLAIHVRADSGEPTHVAL
jgi:hypothetical protein